MSNREQVVILGGGGHAKVVIDILQSHDDVQLAGYLSSDGEAGPLCGAPCLGSDDRLSTLFGQGIRSAFVAIGDNALRKERTAALRGLGYRVINAISPRASVSSYVTVGAGIAIMPGAAVNAGTVLGDGAVVNTNASIDHDCLIGAFAHIAPGAALAGKVQLGEGAFLGIGASVIPGVSIGTWASVGAGSVVVRNIPDGVTAFGVPARARTRKLKNSN